MAGFRDTVRRRIGKANGPTARQASALLAEWYGPAARFRPGQLEAITAVVEDHARLLVIQRTGWGKSLVYLMATRLMREQGVGPTLLLSPLLSLMRNQLLLADQLGLRAASLTSENRKQWGEIQARLAANEIDLLMISPERLANLDFRAIELPRLQSGIGMLVVDEAHCISDWGHDFRPDYRRIVQVVESIPTAVPVLATTATANLRAIDDVREQLGTKIRISRGPLARETLRLQTIELPAQSQRLAWLATHLSELPGTGIIYCLTVRDTQLVSAFLANHRIDGPPYHADLDPEIRVHREELLLRNEVKALCATVALGMGFDKPDLGFVVHFQRPSSLVSYYQQIGRAGRATADAWTILLCGEEDDRISERFIETAFPDPQVIVEILHTLDRYGPIPQDDLERSVNLAYPEIQQCLRFLEVDGAIVRDESGLRRSPVPWVPEIERWRRITAQRQYERKQIQGYMATRECMMQFVIRALDDAGRRRCGRCANCAGDFVDRSYRSDLAEEADRFLRHQWIAIEPRTHLPDGVLPQRPRQIDPQRVTEEGLALCEYSWTGLGRLVADGKYRNQRFDDELVSAAAEAIRATWPIDPTWWIAPVPSRRHPELVPDFATRLATMLGISMIEALHKARDIPEQKSMRNSGFQCRNVIDAFLVDPALCRPGPVLLVDDLSDSRWTLAVCGAALRRSGSGRVYPFVLAAQRKDDGR